jgi:hypothetical protein
MRRFIAIPVLCFCAVAAAAQSGDLGWRTDPQPAVAEAKRLNRPLMVYVLGATRDRDEKLDDAQRRAFSDLRVQRLAQRFVPLKLSRSVHRDVLKDFGLPESANMVMSFVTPEGKPLGDLGAAGIAQADSLAAKMKLVLRAYVEQLYESDLKPLLTDADAKPADVKRALQAVAEQRILAAESDLVAMLEREKRDAAVRPAVCEALAALSTKTAVTKLLDLSGTGDRTAAKALEKCTPAGAELLLGMLKPDDEPFDYPLYKLITKVCGIREVKPEKWFDTAKPKARQEHFDKLDKLVRDAAAAWKEANDAD